MSKDMIMVASRIPKGSALHEAIEREQEATGRSVTDIIRDALVDRYEDRILESIGVSVVRSNEAVPTA